MISTDEVITHRHVPMTRAGCFLFFVLLTSESMNTVNYENAPFNVQTLRLAVLNAWRECCDAVNREAEYAVFLFLCIV